MKRGNAIAVAIAALALALHSIASLRYGYFRDELYFIAAAHHLAWGYADMPPLSAFVAWLTGPFGYALFALRVLPSIAAAGTVYVACLLARELRGGTFSQIVAGLTALLLPANLFLGSTLTTTSFEPLTWTLACYLTLRLGNGAGMRLWYVLAAAVAIALYAKYSILLVVLGICFGLLFTQLRTTLRDRSAVIAAGIVVVAILPNLLWQSSHGWPFIEVLREHVVQRTAYNSGFVFQTSNLAYNAYLFTLEQFVFTNPLLVPVWLTGVVASLAARRMHSARFLGVAFLVVMLAGMILGAKSYYVAGIYPSVGAIGAVALESWRVRWARNAIASICLAGAAAIAPIVMPLLPVPSLIAYEQHLGIKETAGNPPRLAQPLFAEEFGWPELALHVASIYGSLPANLRARTAIFADNYGDAAAVDFYGARYGLPRAISGQDAYYDWGPGGYDGSSVIAIGASRVDVLRASFRSVRLVTTYLHPYRWSAEGPTPIYYCSEPVAPLRLLWPRFKWYGV